MTSYQACRIGSSLNDVTSNCRHCGNGINHSTSSQVTINTGYTTCVALGGMPLAPQYWHAKIN